MKTTKNYNREITFESLNNFVNYAFNSGYEVETIEGVLNDTYIIHNIDKKLSVKGVKPRDFIILYSKFLSAWNNSFHILMTDDEKKVEQFNTSLTQ